MCNIAQHTLEPMLLERARDLGADIRLQHEVLSVTQSTDRVTARVRPGNGEGEVEVVALREGQRAELGRGVALVHAGKALADMTGDNPDDL